MKVKERGSERRGSTTAWFTSFSGETVQAMLEPAIRHSKYGLVAENPVEQRTKKSSRGSHLLQGVLHAAGRHSQLGQ
jgi:hypothetical protein